MNATSLLGSLVTCGALALGAQGCGGSSHHTPVTTTTTSSPVTENETRELLQTTNVVSTAAAWPFQLAMGAIDPGNYSGSTSITGSLNTTVTGTAGSGSILIDFSGGSTAVSGQITATYTGSTSTANVTVTFNNFSATGPEGTFTINGSLALLVSYSGSNATGTLTGSVTMNVNGVTTSLSLTETVDYDAVAERFVIAGNATVTHSVYGVWTVTLAGVTYEQSGAQTGVTTGTVVLTRTLPFPSTATYVFTGLYTGTFTVDPLGITGTFSL